MAKELPHGGSNELDVIPEEALRDLETFIRRRFEEFDIQRPQYPTDPEEEARRLDLLCDDPIYLEMERHLGDPGIPEKEKERIAIQAHKRWWEMVTSSNS